MADRLAKVQIEVPVAKQQAVLAAIADALKDEADDPISPGDSGERDWKDDDVKKLAASITGVDPSDPNNVPHDVLDEKERVVALFLLEDRRSAVPAKELARKHGLPDEADWQRDLPGLWAWCKQQNLKFPFAAFTVGETHYVHCLLKEEDLGPIRAKPAAAPTAPSRSADKQKVSGAD